MLNFEIPNLPERARKPRKRGLTMALDKGYSIRQAEDLVAVAADYIDFIKFGWCTSYLTPNLKEKIDFYTRNDISVYLGGTLFEAFVVRGAFDDYCRLLDDLGLGHVEVSNGSIDMTLDDKLKYIAELKKNFFVLSEIGSKDGAKVMAPYLWVQHIQAELDVGSSIIITEARESGTVGIYRPTGEVRTGLIDEILHEIPSEKLLFEAPNKAQQVWFIELLGTDVNLGNIDPKEVIGLETLRLGLRGDTFHFFLNKEEDL